MKKLILVLIVLMAVSGALFASGQADTASLTSYPEKDITTVVVWGAGAEPMCVTAL